MSGKGGARNFVKSFIDPGLLFQALSKHEDLLPEFGLYDRISRNQSIDPKGLVEVLPLLKDLIKVSPSADIHTNPLRSALLKVVCNNPSVNTSKWNGTVWANIRCERIGVLLLHMRRLKSSDEVRKAAAKLTSRDLMQLQEVISLIQFEPEEDAPKKRVLKKQVSDVSLDSEGYPRFNSPAQKGKGTGHQDTLVKGEKQTLVKGENQTLVKGGTKPLLKGKASSAKDSPSPSFLRRRKGSSVYSPGPSEAAESQSPHLAKAMGFTSKSKNGKKRKGGKKVKQESPLKKPASSALVGKGMPMKKPAAALGKSAKLPWKKLRIVFARKPQRGYITGTQEIGGKCKLIVEVSSFRSAQYKRVINTIYERLRDDNLSKAEALQLRSELC